MNLDARAVKGVWPWPCQHVLPLRQCWFLSFSSQVQIQSKKVDISKVSSKCGSKANIKHKPGECPSLPWCPASGLSPSVCHCTVVLARLPRDSAEDSAVLPLREREERESRLRLQGPHLGALCAGAADQDLGRAFPGSGVGPGHSQFRRKLSQRCSGGHTGWRGEPHPVAWAASVTARSSLPSSLVECFPRQRWRWFSPNQLLPPLFPLEPPLVTSSQGHCGWRSALREAGSVWRPRPRVKHQGSVCDVS